MTINGFKRDASGPWIEVSPGAVLDYAEAWDDWLAAVTDTIASVVWTVPADLTVQSQSNTTVKASVWLSGFALGTTYECTCAIVTAAGRHDSRSFRLVCKKR